MHQDIEYVIWPWASLLVRLLLTQKSEIPVPREARHDHMTSVVTEKMSDTFSEQRKRDLDSRPP